MAGECIYADEKYSEGSVLVVDEVEYECHEGQWYEGVESKSVSASEDSSNDVDEPRVAAKEAPLPCYYAGKEYSSGAPLKMPNGKVYRCIEGKWHPKGQPL